MRKLISLSILPLSLVALSVISSCSESSKTEPSAAESTEVKDSDTASKPVVHIGKVSFNEHIQPILSANCYHCHGPDSGTRLPEDEPYRLDNAEGAFEVRKNGKPNIIKGDPDNSYVIQLMESKDVDKVMPLHPTKSAHGKIMDPADIALVRRWVKEGAVFEDHWAYISPKKAELPEVKHKDWVRNEVDRFILAKLEQRGLEPNQDEDKARLLRRLTFDLTGLPPTPDELGAFLNDKRDFELVYQKKSRCAFKN